jgi:two-component system, OmpR family, KDP operon response regulator KdpE
MRFIYCINGNNQSMPPDRILIVDSESKSAYLLRQILSNAGFAVLVTNKGDRAIGMVADEQPVLVITETSLPGEINGFDLIRRIREFSEIPIIIVSTSAETEDILSGFAAGADEYITKPFETKILLARLKAVLNRSKGRLSAPAEIICNDLTIDQAARHVTLSGQQIYLTETEYNLLVELARHRNKVMLHEQLLLAVWGPKFSNEVDYLRSYIHMLRRKLEIDPSRPALIISRPGIGYMLVSTPPELPGK